ncbi:uncharacterized protein METZ01_LOCUS174040 [marine metagenome]|uniref:Uncharacterized protein n=1 Tax=marine metagenome TaxID=408172 RepID=A0A382C548_9ZZZZ
MLLIGVITALFQNFLVMKLFPSATIPYPAPLLQALKSNSRIRIH